MKRYRYDSILKGIAKLTGGLVFLISAMYFFLSLFYDEEINVPSIIFGGIGTIIVLIGFLLSLVLRFKKKCCVEFLNGKVYYQGKCLYNCNIKYIKLYISLIDPSLVIPRLHITYGSNNLEVYLTKRDVKKLIKEKYEVKII